MRIVSGGSMPFPPGWTRVASDPGTAGVALFSPSQGYLGYLNITPRQSDESLSNWSRFRTQHNAEEQHTKVTTVAAATGLRFRGGQGSCVKDAYTTNRGTRYIELACLVAGRRTSFVIVGAATPQDWRQISPLLERSISGVDAS